MKIEWLIFAVVLLAALIPVFRSQGRSWRFTGLILLGSAVTIAAAAALQKQLTRRSDMRQEVMKTLPREGRPGGYISSDSCQSCHPREYHTWRRSYHRTMTQYA